MLKQLRLVRESGVAAEVVRRRVDGPGITAHHEAGHAVIGYHYSFVIKSIEIGRNAEAEAASGMAEGRFSAGNTLIDFGNDDPHGPYVSLKAEAIACQQFAGHIASTFFAPDVSVTLAKSDYESARDVLLQYGRPTGKRRDLERYVEELEKRTASLVEKHWQVVNALAKDLVQRTKLPGRRATAIVEMHYQGVRPPPLWRSPLG